MTRNEYISLLKSSKSFFSDSVVQKVRCFIYFLDVHSMNARIWINIEHVCSLTFRHCIGCHKKMYACRTGAMSGHCNTACITSKCANILLQPMHSSNDVHQTVIGRRLWIPIGICIQETCKDKYERGIYYYLIFIRKSLRQNNQRNFFSFQDHQFFRESLKQERFIICSCSHYTRRWKIWKQTDQCAYQHNEWWRR